jgi:hypothetical protein
MNRNHVVSWRRHGAALSGCEESLGPRTITFMPTTDSLGLVSFMVLVRQGSQVFSRTEQRSRYEEEAASRDVTTEFSF